MTAVAAKPLTSYRKYWAQRFGIAPFLPMSRAESQAASTALSVGAVTLARANSRACASALVTPSGVSSYVATVSLCRCRVLLVLMASSLTVCVCLSLCWPLVAANSRKSITLS